MTLTAYALSAIIAFSGVIAGAILAFRTPEEIAGAEKYLPRLQQVLFVAIACFFIYSLRPAFLVAVIISAAAVFAAIARPGFNYYPVLAAVFFLSGQSAHGLFAVSALIFLYGFPTGSMHFIKNRNEGLTKILKKAALKYGIFLLLSLGFQVLYSAFVLRNIF